MADVVSKKKRSEMMAGIRGKNTKPEIIVRKMLHAMGYRFRLHRKDLPGKPDIVLPKYRAAIFVNGCFWHGHDCHLFKWPKTREAFWREKIVGNVARDQKKTQRLLDNGWRVAVIWECSLKGSGKISMEKLEKCLQDRLRKTQPKVEIRGGSERQTF